MGKNGEVGCRIIHKSLEGRGTWITNKELLN